MRRVLHLTGSPTDEEFADLSRLYAADCLRAVADPGRYEMLIADVQPDGSWRFPASLEVAELSGAPSLPITEALIRINQWRPDVIVPQLFCPAGMTDYRSIPPLLGLPMIGNPTAVMALGADKPAARAVVAEAGVSVPDGFVVRRGETLAAHDRWPVVVKPASSDNSWGLSLVTSATGLPAALERAWQWGDAALVEDFVPLGREVRCGILERDGELVGLPLEEYAVDARTAPIRTAEDKLRRGGDGELELVAKQADRAWIVDPHDPVVGPVHDAARRAYRALGCRQYGLFDFRIDPAGRPWFLEAGLYCSFAPSSVIVTMARAAGISVRDLFDECVSGAIRS